MSIYYAINLDIISSCIIFSYLYLGSIDLLQLLNLLILNDYIYIIKGSCFVLK